MLLICLISLIIAVIAVILVGCCNPNTASSEHFENVEEDIYYNSIYPTQNVIREKDGSLVIEPPTRFKRSAVGVQCATNDDCGWPLYCGIERKICQLRKGFRDQSSQDPFYNRRKQRLMSRDT
jgi:hypothetical protein